MAAVLLVARGTAGLGAAAVAVGGVVTGVSVGEAGVWPDTDVPSGFVGVSDSPPEAGAAFCAADFAAGACNKSSMRVISWHSTPMGQSSRSHHMYALKQHRGLSESFNEAPKGSVQSPSVPWRRWAQEPW